MPLLKHAKKKQRQDNKKAVVQKNLKVHYKELIKAVREKPSQEAANVAYQAIDKAAKINLIHDNKAAHLKSDVAKAVAGKVSTVPVKKTVKSTPKVKKTTPKKK